MTLKKYITPETDVVILNTKDKIMIGGALYGSTYEQFGNKVEFDSEEGDPFFND